MIYAGKFKEKIKIYKIKTLRESDGFMEPEREEVLSTYAEKKQARGFTLLMNNTDLLKTYTNFIIRFPKTKIDRKMQVEHKGRFYSIEYLNNVNEADEILEMQCKAVEK